MVLSWIWCILICMSILFSLLLGKGSEVASAVPAGAQNAIELSIAMAGSLCLWTGVGRLMEKAGITGMLSKLLSPVLNRLFPSAKGDAVLAGDLSANICANLLGLGNAATPAGIRAAKGLADPVRPGLATDEMCRLVVLSTASIQLIPATVAAVRSGLGCPSPFDILPAVWITSLCSATAGLVAAFWMGKLWRRG